MDILGINTSGENVFIKHSSTDKCWMVGEEAHQDIVHILIDPASIQTGWGIYEGGYSWEWDDKPGVSKGQPTSEHKRAFSVWMYTKEHGSKLWRRFSWGESQGFNSMCATFWNDIKANPGKVVHMKYTGAKVEKFKVGQAAIPQFEFVKWADKPADFVTNDVDMPLEQAATQVNNDFNFVMDNQTPESGDPRFDPSAKPLTEDDLPF
jgi:hypothetical protein